jgi:DNA-binding MarR family transcriptional regulator
MHAAVKAKGAEVTDRELALELASLMLHCFRGRGNEVLRVIDDSGLSLVQMKTVIAISSQELPEETTVTALSETLGVSPASASRAVDGLVKQKLASRVEDAEDRRVRRVTLTARGHELADRIISARLAGLEDFTASLDDVERRKLAVALEALMEREEIAELYRTNQERFGR